MITLEQIRLLESKITRAIDLIRVLKDENSALRKGVESAQRRMRELETLVDGFKTDQKEIESVIVRTLHNLDELEEAAAGSPADATVNRGGGGIQPADAVASRGTGGSPSGGTPAGGIMADAIPATSGGTAASAPRAEARTAGSAPATSAASSLPGAAPGKDEPPAPKEELDIF